MKVLIFGGTGMLGSHLCKRLLLEGDSVVVASRRGAAVGLDGADWLRCDVSSEMDVARVCAVAHADAVVHLAASLQFVCEADPSVSVHTNVGGTLNVLSAAASSKARHVIFGSSLAVYGQSTETLSESTPPSADTSLYGRAKWLEEALGRSYAALHGFRFTALRYSGVFGAGSAGGPGMSSIRKQIERTAAGDDVTVSGASGEERAQLTYLDDAVGATIVVLKANSLRSSVYNVAGPAENYLSLRDYHETIRRLFPGAGRVHFTGTARSAGRLTTRRLEEEAGFVATTTVEEGLRRMASEENLGKSVSEAK